MTDNPIAEGVKLDDAFRVEQIYKWTNPHDLTPEGWQFIIKMARKGAALTAAGEMARELAEAREALKPLIKLKEAIDECKDDTWECQCGRSEPWWTGSNAHYASEYPDVPK